MKDEPATLPQTAAGRSRAWKFVYAGLVVAFVEWAFGPITWLLNPPVGEPTMVTGTLTEPCRQTRTSSQFTNCTVRLSDGSRQTYSTTLASANPGQQVEFARYQRRFFGSAYELKCC